MYANFVSFDSIFALQEFSFHSVPHNPNVHTFSICTHSQTVDQFNNLGREESGPKTVFASKDAMTLNGVIYVTCDFLKKDICLMYMLKINPSGEDQ